MTLNSPGIQPMYRIGKEQIAIMKASAQRMNIDETTRDTAAAIVRLNEPFIYYIGLLEGIDWCFVHQGVLVEQSLSKPSKYYEYHLISMVSRVIEIIEQMPEYAALP